MFRSARYTEAIDTLYTTNTFDFDCANSLFRFIRSVPSQRLACIRAVRFYINYRPTRAKFTFLPTTWTTLWETLSSSTTMTRLEHLYATMNVERRMDVHNDPDLLTYHWDEGTEVELLAPLAMMARRDGEVNEFKLDVGWALGGEVAVHVPEFCKVSRVDIGDD